MPKLIWPDYSHAQYAAIAETLSSAIVVAQHGERRCREASRTDTTGIMAANAEYFRHAAKFLRWLSNTLEQRRAKIMSEAKRSGNTNR